MKILINRLITKCFYTKLIFSFIFMTSFAHAKSEVEASPTRTCGKVLYLSGEVLLLDYQRKEYKEIKIGTPVQCGDWISTGKLGKVVVDFNPYGKMIIGLNTFFQSLDPDQSTEKNSKITDNFVLFKGDVYIEGNAKTTESSMVTPNSRVYLKNGKSIVSFLEEPRSTQVISLEGSLKYKNRFLDHKPWVVEKGTISKITDGEERLLPSQQAIIEANSLDLKLKELEVESKLRKSIVEYVTELSKKKSVVKLGGSHPILFTESKKSNTNNITTQKTSSNNQCTIASVSEAAPDENKLQSKGRNPASFEEKNNPVRSKKASHLKKLKNLELNHSPVLEEKSLLNELSQIKEGEEE